MVYRPKINPSLAFVLMPFRPPFDSYYDDIIKPAAKAAGLDARRADEIYSTGPIIQDIWNQIWAATVVIADVAGKNPNVNYELGICHALGVPTVMITQSMDDVPFDYRHRRCITYSTQNVDWQRRLKKGITGTLKAVLKGDDVAPELAWPYETSPFNSRESDALVPAIAGRDLVIRGVRMVRDAVAYAYGPRGTRVSANIGLGKYEYQRRGTAIAASVHSPNALETNGIAHSKQVADEMRDSVGDGSKTAILLFCKILENGSQALKQNHPVLDVIRGMERSTEAIVSAIRNSSRKPSELYLQQVARTAAHGDSTLANLTVAAYKRAGSDGVVFIEQSGSPDTSLVVQEGMQFDRGYIDPGFLAASGEHECTLEDAYILICEFKISSMKDLLPVLEQVAVAQAALLVIADDVEGEALATLIVNRQRGTLDCLAVRAPGYADRRRAILQDIAVLTAATLVTPTLGRSLETVTLKQLGRARKVIVSKDSTTILGGAGEGQVAPYVESIRDELAATKDPYSAEKLRERLAKLNGAVAAIRVGGLSPQERIDRLYYAESAMYSTGKAIEEGVVAGGGVSFTSAAKAVTKINLKRPGEVAGVNAIVDALDEPARQLLASGGADPGDSLDKIKRSKKPNAGVDVETGTIQDLVLSGVLDPTVTVTRALQLASLHARTVLSTGAWDSSTQQSAVVPDAAAADLPQEPADK